jgi:hypothetical protein
MNNKIKLPDILICHAIDGSSYYLDKAMIIIIIDSLLGYIQPIG